jgi:Flp pilus assembly pilin Flp
MDSGKRAGERGAVLVEYMMLVGLMAIVAITGARVLGATTSRQFGAAAAGLASSDPGSSASPDTSPPATTPATTTPTTVPVTTPPATTAPTTTVPMTTPPTTQPPVASKGAVQLSTPTTSALYGYWWGTSQMVVSDNLGAPVSGAHVTLTISAYTKGSNGRYSWVTTTGSETTDSDGAVSLLVGPYRSTTSTGDVAQVVVTVSSVTLSRGLAWDGNPASITVNSP